ncbi:MAG: undecaprenyldiphospho-muramoylpentapeptide beta-N-acetylglucosaminyltransferase [Candidatus Paceibacterota bacterium]
MKIILTGGGTGGHFYPLMAVADSLYEKAKKEKLLSNPELFYLAPEPYDPETLDKYGVSFRSISAGKMRTHFSLYNIFDAFKTGWGIVKAIWTVFSIYPDVIFAKGGYVSFPVLVAARLMRIPVFIHESDSVPGRVNRWAGKFAQKVAVSFPEAAGYFDEEKVALTGNPIRSEIANPATAGARQFLDMEDDVPVIFVIGGSQGSQRVNSIILETLPRLIEDYYVIHQVGEANLASTNETTEFFFSELPRDKQELKYRYKPFGFLDENAMRMAAGAADIVISRAGSTIFEIAAWAVPSILIPLTESHADHQRKNAYAYAASGAATVIDEANLGDDILMSELKEIMDNSDVYERMATAAAKFAQLDAADTIADEIIYLARTHA